MGNSESEEKIIKPQGSTIVSVQHKEYESIEDCEELRQLKQLPKTVPLRPSTTFPYQTNPNPAANLGQHHKTSLSDTQKDREIRENDVDQSSNQSKNNHLLTPSIIGTSYSNNSSNKSGKSGGSYEREHSASKRSSDGTSPFNPKTMLRPPSYFYCCYPCTVFVRSYFILYTIYNEYI